MLSINAVNTYRIPQSFEYYRPDNLREALELLSSIENAKVIAGGTDLVVDLKYRRVEPRALVDISRLSELRFVKVSEQYAEIGGAVTLQELLENDSVRTFLPLLAEAVEHMGSWQIRNFATIGGNVCNASPAADSALPLLAYDADFKLVSLRGTRVIPAEKFFVGPKMTLLEHGEILYSIIVPIHQRRFGWSFVKIGRTSLDLAKVNVAVLLSFKDDLVADARIALGAVAPTPVRARSVERSVIGMSFDEALSAASEAVENDIAPIDDVRSTAWYRLHAAKILVREAMWRAYERLLQVGVGS